MSEFGLVRVFGIDDGELDGLSPQKCFVLGYELARIDARLATGEAFTQAIHAENRERIEEECDKKNRVYSVTWMEGDSSESWLQLRVDRQ